ncbi:type II toxin-antitoxin system RelE/ParE family toxin [Maridesulfovibrio sp.]|uniref:type II toxin-antitoxin system RelE/ParE family toxin n=1 Tax=Maridesulfovibrio sp. TaxID=2795000 RepID=UPI002A187B05|nr:type II toxin-antitoxin system RelE/ParE family toxin [Maridesulfovibrio sp.]
MNQRQLFWVGTSKKDLLSQAVEVRQCVGYALHTVQNGGIPENSKPFKQGGSGVMEIVVNHDTDTYRTMYVAKLQKGIYILHSFQKKSKTGKATPKSDIEKIQARYREALKADNE